MTTQQVIVGTALAMLSIMGLAAFIDFIFMMQDKADHEFIQRQIGEARRKMREERGQP